MYYITKIEPHMFSTALSLSAVLIIKSLKKPTQVLFLQWSATYKAVVPLIAEY